MRYLEKRHVLTYLYEDPIVNTILHIHIVNANIDQSCSKYLIILTISKEPLMRLYGLCLSFNLALILRASLNGQRVCQFNTIKFKHRLHNISF